MANPMAWRGFSALFLGTAVLCGSATLVLGRLPDALRCRATTAPDSFMSECRGIGDYEHAAYALALEPAAVAALGRAEVVILGNSRAQFAFSADAARSWFAERGVRAYRAAFGYDEGSPFALTVLRRAGARPGLAIVNADTFFTERLSQPAARIRDDPWRAWIGGLRNRAAIRLRADFCGSAPLARLCRGTRSAIHRVRSDGAWAWQDSLRPAGDKTEIDRQPGERRSFPDGTEARARGLLADMALSPSCLVLTSVPNSLSDFEAATAALAQDLGARTIMLRLTGLRTIDGSHLDAESAERWSRAFLSELEPALRDCLEASGPTAAAP